MSARAAEIEALLAANGTAILIEILSTFGSAPRDRGAFMLVTPLQTVGTIGGGQLEFMAIDHARKLLRAGGGPEELDIPLGPEIGQCCGGRVHLRLTPLQGETTADLLDRTRADEKAWPEILIFGAGHVGRALATSLAPLPFRTSLFDTRPDLLAGLPPEIAAHTIALPESAVRAAGPGAAFVAVTHDHALDFLITREALLRDDAVYAGMIGSKSKRAQFRRWFLAEGGTSQAFSGLVCPIGAQAPGDKRPNIIAALTAAEIIAKFSLTGWASADKGDMFAPATGDK